jgi:hypothetical protein
MHRALTEEHADMTTCDRRDLAALCRKHRIRFRLWPFGLDLVAGDVPDECLRLSALVARRTGRLVCAGVVTPV